MKRNTLYLLGLLVLLLIVAFLLMQRPGEQSVPVETGRHFIEIDSLAVDRIEIISPKQKVVLEKKGVEWFLQEPLVYRADQTNVASLIHETKSLETKNIISSKAEKHSVFQVDSSGTLVKIFEKGAQKAAFVLGKMGPTFSETYARLANSNAVALVAGASSYTFNRPLKEWRDRTIFNIPKESIKEVKFQYGDTTFVLAFKDSVWMIGKDSTQESAVTSLLSSVTDVQADEFVDTLRSPSPKINAQISCGGVDIRFAEVTKQIPRSNFKLTTMVRDAELARRSTVETQEGFGEDEKINFSFSCNVLTVVQSHARANSLLAKPILVTFESFKPISQTTLIE